MYSEAANLKSAAMTPSHDIVYCCVLGGLKEFYIIYRNH